MVGLARSRRLRETPFSRRVDAAGVAGYTVYNHMLLATNFGDIVAALQAAVSALLGGLLATASVAVVSGAPADDMLAGSFASGVFIATYAVQRMRLREGSGHALPPLRELMKLTMPTWISGKIKKLHF